MSEPLRGVVEGLRAIVSKKHWSDVRDADLVRHFVETRSSDAFGCLMRRHGPMVMGLARRVVRDQQVAEDVFQATFLILARKAKSIRGRDALPAWLHSVALRLATRAKKSRQRIEEKHTHAVKNSPTPSPSDPLDEITAREYLTILDEEIAKLPEKYRLPLILCQLEGLSQEDAAKRLGVSSSSIKGMLERGRTLLRQQLTGRGLPAGSLPLGPLAFGSTAKAAVGHTLIQSTLHAAMTNQGASAAAVALAEGAIMLMTIKKITIACVAAVIFGVVAYGAGLAGYHSLGAYKTPEEEPRPLEAGNVTLEQPVQPKDNQPRLDLHGDPLPDGAVARLGQDRWLNGGSCGTATFLPDGNSVLTTCADGTIRIFDFPSGKEIRRIARPPLATTKQGPSGDFQASFPSPDGKTIAVQYHGEPKKMFLFDITGNTKLPVLELQETSSAPIFSPDGVHLTTVAPSRMVRTWDWLNGKEVATFSTDEVKKVPRKAFPPPFPSLGYNSLVTKCRRYTPDGKGLILAHVVRGASSSAPIGKPFPKSQPYVATLIQLWDPATGKVIRDLFESPNKFGTEPHLALSRDGKHLAVYAGESTIRIVEVSTGKEIHKLPAESGTPSTMVFGKDGTKLYAVCVVPQTGKNPPYSSLIEWEIATAKPLRKCPLTYIDQVLSAFAMSPDGDTLVLSGTGPQCFDISAGKDITPINSVSKKAHAAQFLPDGKSVLTMGSPFNEQWVQWWDAITGKDLGVFRFPMQSVMARAVSPDGKLIAAVLGGFKAKNTVLIMGSISEKQIGQFSLQNDLGTTWGLTFSPDGNTLAGLNDTTGRLSLYEVPSGNELRAWNVGPTGGGMSFSPDGTKLAVMDSKAIEVWDIARAQRIGSLAPDAKWIHARFTPDSRCLAVANDDGTTGLYELATMQLRCKFGKTLDSHNEPNSTLPRPRLAFSPTGKVFARTGLSGTVCLLDSVTGEKLKEFKGHTDGVIDLAFSPDGKALASASDDSTVLIWDLSKIKRLPPPTKALTPADLEECWNALADNDAAKAWAKMRDLMASPEDSVPFLNDRIKPAVPPRKNLEMVLQGEDLRACRAIEVLELIGTPVARQALGK